ncbi:hypothetical protein T09_4609 [Trichinella sp. T9]|nr:hypothetical protein T09_4609 [Trichinella sp. T9]
MLYDAVCNEPLSRAGSFVASTGLLPQSSPNGDTPVLTCGFITASVSSVRLLPALPPLFPNSRFQQRPPPISQTPDTTLSLLIIIRSTVLLPDLQFPESRIANMPLNMIEDMNCIPDAALHELIEKGTVSSQCTDWRIKGALQYSDN